MRNPQYYSSSPRAFLCAEGAHSIKKPGMGNGPGFFLFFEENFGNPTLPRFISDNKLIIVCRFFFLISEKLSASGRVPGFICQKGRNVN